MTGTGIENGMTGTCVALASASLADEITRMLDMLCELDPKRGSIYKSDCETSAILEYIADLPGDPYFNRADDYLKAAAVALRADLYDTLGEYAEDYAYFGEHETTRNLGFWACPD